MLSLNKLTVFLFTISVLSSLNLNATDFYVTNSSLNFRNGPGMNYKSILVLKKGDTLEAIDVSNQIWIKASFKGTIGYVSKKHITPIQVPLQESAIAIPQSPQKSDTSGTIIVLIVIFFLFLIMGIAIKKLGSKRKSKTAALILALLFGTFGFHKFYLGKPILGSIYILLSWTLIPTLIGFVECCLIAIMKDHEFDQKYNQKTPTKDYKSTYQPKNEDQKNDKRIIITTSTTTNSYSYKHSSFSNQTKSHTTDPIVNKTNTFSTPNNNQNKSADKKEKIERPNSKSISLNSEKNTIISNNDNSIIDISSEKLNLNIDQSLDNHKNIITPPYWKQFYVYSQSDIHKANQKQLEFYNYLKEKVSIGEFVDIDHNTNYAFILYFDFFKEYEKHQDIQKLDKQIELIAHICPKTKPYSYRLLESILRKRDDSYSINRLEVVEDTFISPYSDYNPDIYKLGNQYKTKLELSNKEIKWLNKFYNPTNVFLAIEGCCIATIKHYLYILKSLETLFKNNNSTLNTEIQEIKDLLKGYYIGDSSEWGYYDDKYLAERSESEIYLTIFKRTENHIREYYGHKRKISSDFPNVERFIIDAFEMKIGNQVNKLLNHSQKEIIKPNLETQIELNSQNVNRWKEDFSKLKEGFNIKELQKFKDEIKYLENTNQKNPNIENIFYEASKFLARYDKTQALKYYAYYIFYDLNSKKFDNKTLTKTVQKSLFKNEEQLHTFRKICSDLIATKDLEKTLLEIDNIYIPKRKKIELDQSAIEEVENKHENTVELLNEYLNDSLEIDTTTDAEIEVAVISDKENNSQFIPEISFNKIQEKLIMQIVENNFEINQSIVDQFATQNGVFKNQLIDSINEICEDYLDGEPLLEEDGDNYIIEESFYLELKK